MQRKYWLTCLSLITLFFSCNEIAENGKTASHKPAMVEGYYQGMELYETNCILCHKKTGIPELPIFPPLKGSDYLRDNQSNIACIIRNGISEPLKVNGKDYKVKMNGFEELSAQDIGQIINYINHSWGNDFGETNTQKVIKELENCVL